QASDDRGWAATRTARSSRGRSPVSARCSSWRNAASASGSTVLGRPVDIWIGCSDMPARYDRGRWMAAPYSGPVLAWTLGQAKTIALVAAVILVALAVVSAWVMKTVAQKAALAVILGLLALLVWTQRSALQECADKVRAE